MVSVVPEELDMDEESLHLLSWTLNKIIHVAKMRVCCSNCCRCSGREIASLSGTNDHVGVVGDLDSSLVDRETS